MSSTGSANGSGSGAGSAAQAVGQALALARTGRVDEAEQLCRLVLEREPGSFEALGLLGLLAHQQGRAAEADELLARACSMRPGAADLLAARALVLRALGQHEQAVAVLDQALAARPRFFEAHFNRGNALLTLRRPEEALASFDAALAVNAGDAGAWIRRGGILRQLDRKPEALTSYDRALSLAPDEVEALRCKAQLLQALGRHDEALPVHERGFELQPDATGALGVGNALQALARYEEALAAADRALSLQPGMSEALTNRGNALRALGRHQEALECYAGVIAQQPDDVGAHWNEGLTRLTLGDFARGWAQHEWRLRGLSDVSGTDVPDVPTWRGSEDLAGKTILLRTEQGFGDALQFIRYATPVAERGARVVVACRAPLADLFRTVAGVEEVVSSDLAPAPVDYQAFLMSLPLAFRTRLDTIPATIPYVHADARRVEAWRERLAALGAGRKIGLVWRGNPEHTGARNRDCPARLLDPLFEVPDCRFFGLQLTEGVDDIATMRARGCPIVDLAAELGDFHETAALIEALDLLITVDTAAAHLAGALGRPAWVMLPFAADWRWLLEREDSPWYPSLRLFRQATPGDWRDVVERVAGALRSFPTHPPRSERSSATRQTPRLSRDRLESRDSGLSKQTGGDDVATLPRLRGKSRLDRDISPGAGTPAANACSWVAADGSNPRLLTLTVLHGNVTREDWLTGGGSADDIVEGVGEFAARVGSQLQVYQGGWLVGVTVRGSDRPEAAQDLARTVLGKLTG
jgi:tetratricopeptide (TPR) repeat protein